MGNAIAIVAVGCRFPDAADPDRLWETVLWQRRAFRPMPRARLGKDYVADDGGPDTTYVRFAAVLDGWSFDRIGHRVPGPTYRVTEPTHWLALDVASETLAASGVLDDPEFDRDRAAWSSETAWPASSAARGLCASVGRMYAESCKMRWPTLAGTAPPSAS
jgi:enediyne polyketide synthase